MGCKSSKVSKTAVEIIRIRQDVTSDVKWRKRKKKVEERSDENQESFLISKKTSGRKCSSIESPNSLTTNGSSVTSFPSAEDLALEPTVTMPHQIVPSGNVEKVTIAKRADASHCVDISSSKGSSQFLSSCASLDKGKGSSPPPPSGRKSRMATDVSVQDIDDDEIEDALPRNSTSPIPKGNRASRCMEKSSSMTTDTHVPLIVHSAWSDFSVPQKRRMPSPWGWVKSRSRVKTIGPGKAGIDKRERPMAAKGPRRPPNLTDLYGAELSLPGTPCADPKRVEEERCLNAWMTRRLEDGAH